MSNYNLKTIVNQLNDFCAWALQSGVEFAASRRHYEVTVEHVLLKILEKGDNDLSWLLQHYFVDQDALWQGLLENLAAQTAGNQGKPGFSPQLYNWLEHSLLANSLHYQQTQIRSIALLDALIQLANRLPGNLAEKLQAVELTDMHKNYSGYLSQSKEQQQSNNPGVDLVQTNNNDSVETALTRFTHDITAKAEGGGIDPVIGRETEIRMMVDVLMRRRKNNPILVGEPGVGKTAIVEGFALRIANADVPEVLKKVRVHTLDLGLLQAGAGVKGEFEKRLQQVIEEVKAASQKIILFIDEAHSLIGAGGDAGTGDAANLLKPALARGELRTVAATTWAEYKQYFERDAALERRFQLISVAEPTEQQAIKIISGLKSLYQKHHQVLITDSAITAAVKLSHRYITGRQLPDKAIDLIDTAAARLHMADDVMPNQLDHLQAEQHYLTKRISDIEQQQQQGVFEASDESSELQTKLQQIKEEINMINEQWLQEKKLVDEIKQQRQTIGILLKQNPVDRAKFSWMQEALRETQKELLELQKSKPLIHTELNETMIADVVADLTSIPVNNLVKDEISKLIDLEQALSQRVIGQAPAIHAIAEAIRTRRVGLGNLNAPLGVFMLTGPSGIGKTETAKVVARHLFGGEKFLTTINLSEYQEAHTVSQLKGSPPGYVGYGEGGVLTEAVRQKPYSVVLLDEIEKAHPDVLNMFYQVFDEGQLRDGEGREINFRNTIIILTSNLGSELIQQMYPTDGELEALPDYDEINTAVEELLTQHFAAALLSRMRVFSYLPLRADSLQTITALKLDKLAQRLQKSQQILLRCSPTVIQAITEQALSPERGARAINTIIEQQIEPNIARSILGFLVDEKMPDYLTLQLDANNDIELVFSSEQQTDEASVA